MKSNQRTEGAERVQDNDDHRARAGNDTLFPSEKTAGHAREGSISR